MNSAIFDWNDRASETPDKRAEEERAAIPRIGMVPSKIKVVDETLRDGLQNPTGKNPPVADKAALLPAMARIGVDVVSVGLPAAGGRYEADTIALCEAIRDQKLPLVATAAARTVISDVEGIARAADRTGLCIEVYSFIGSSPIRQYVEGWSTEFLVGAVTGAARTAARHGLPFCLVTEDTTRSHPDLLRTLFRAAIDSGASRLCLCDTTGHVTPYGVEELVGFARRFLAEVGASHVELDWHGHNDRGLGLPMGLCGPRPQVWIAYTAPASASVSAWATRRSRCWSRTSACSARGRGPRGRISWTTAIVRRARSTGRSRTTTRSPERGRAAARGRGRQPGGVTSGRRLRGARDGAARPQRTCFQAVVLAR